jgi:indole-3-glycerol phosphate synthase
MSTILDTILAEKRREVAALDVSALPQARFPRRSFREALLRHGSVALIAEIKRRSPSRPMIREDFDPPAMARAYQAGGAAALSILTDEPFFGGALAFMQAAREACDLPILRKDFIIDEAQLPQARAYGADAVLLIAAALDDPTLASLMKACQRWDLEFLLEVHDMAELERALALGAPLIGVNNRDLKTFKVDLEATRRVVERVRALPNPPTLVSESGIATAEDRRQLESWGVQAMLVGESLLKQPDLELAVKALLA